MRCRSWIARWYHLFVVGLALVGPAMHPARAAPFSVQFQGRILDGDNMNMAVGGIRPGGSVNRTTGKKPLLTAGALGPTDVMGVYDATLTGQLTPAANATVGWVAGVKELKKLGPRMSHTIRTFRSPRGGIVSLITFSRLDEFFKGSQTGTVQLDGMGKATVMVPDIIARKQNVLTTWAQTATDIVAVGQWDPTYAFIPDDPSSATGTLSISNAFDPAAAEDLFQGSVQYFDGTIVLDDSFGETIFHQPVTIADISVLGVNPDGSFVLGDSHIRIGSTDTGIFLDADIVGIVAENDPLNPFFGGLLSINEIGGVEIGSRFVDEVRAVEEALGVISIGFDPTILAETAGFTQSATYSGSAAITAAVPEPSLLLLLGAAWLCLPWRRRELT